jgi:nitroreductase
MKIGVLTLPLHTNIGGNLQAHALMAVLSQLGHEPILIDRRRPTGVGGEETDQPALEDGLLAPPADGRSHSFVECHIQPRTRPFVSDRALTASLPRLGLDAIIVGSDQVWRPKYAKSLLLNFFLDFLTDSDATTRRISYGASFGAPRWEFDPSQTAAAASLIRRFHSVSVREDSGVSLCETHLGVPAQHVLDPTLLLPGRYYASLFGLDADPGPGRGVMTYILDQADDKTRVVDSLAARLSTNAFPATGRDKSTRQWISSFRQAEFVVTDSFHGTVFAILFNKPFLTYGNPNRGLARFTSLLKMFGLEDRLAVQSSDVDVEQMVRPIDWAAVNERLRRLRDQSIGFLLEALHHGHDGARVDRAAAVPGQPDGRGAVPLFATNNAAAWRIDGDGMRSRLRVSAEGAVRGNLAYMSFPTPLRGKTPYTLTLDWSVRTTQSVIGLFVRNPATGKVHRIGEVETGGATLARRSDTISFSVPDDGFAQFVLGATSFTGPDAGADIDRVAVDEVAKSAPAAAAPPAAVAVPPAAKVAIAPEAVAEPGFAEKALKLALKDNAAFVKASGDGLNIGSARARLMFQAHALEKGLSHAQFRPRFGGTPIQRLAKEMNDWVAAGRDPADMFFQAGASAMRAYIARHRQLNIDVSDYTRAFDTKVQEYIARADDMQGGVVTAVADREPVVDAARDRSFLSVVYGRRSVREFTAEEVRDDDIRRAVQIAIQAPSVCNRQGARVHHFKDPDRIKAAVDLQGGFRGWKMPPALLLVTGDQSVFLSPTERNQAFIDGGLFMMSLLLGLEHVGLGSCSLNTAMSDKREAAIRDILGIPQSEVFIAFIAVGHYDPKILVPISKRLPVSSVLQRHEGTATGAS